MAGIFWLCLILIFFLGIPSLTFWLCGLVKAMTPPPPLQALGLGLDWPKALGVFQPADHRRSGIDA
jgi:hypothetical protein